MSRVTSLTLLPALYNTSISKGTGGYRNGYNVSYFDRKFIFMQIKALKAVNLAQHYEPSIKLFLQCIHVCSHVCRSLDSGLAY